MEEARGNSHITFLRQIGDPEFRIERCEAFNDNQTYLQGVAQLVSDALANGRKHTQQLPLRCPMCVNKKCETMREYFCN